MQEFTFLYRIPECIGFAIAIGVIAYGMVWFGFRGKTRRLYVSLDRCRDETKAFSAKLDLAVEANSRMDAELTGVRGKYDALKKELASREAAFEDLARKTRALEKQWADREAKLRDMLQTLEGGEAKTFIREWTGFYQVIIRSFLDVPVQAQGHIRLTQMLERHSFDITIDPKETYPKIVRSLPGSPVG